MNWLKGLLGVATNQLDHVPEADLPAVCLAAGVTPEQWRAVEAAQVAYTAGRIVKQATPRK